jgi:hypothetical protein
VTEYSVAFALKPVETSARTPDEAVTKAAAQIAADLPANVAAVTVTRLDRITVPGFNGQPK